jgi:ABC-type transport system substrate-binding protein
MMEGLVAFKSGTTEVIPALATSWEISKDSLTYTFKLRPNVVFHDGTPMNADSVVFSVERQMNKNHPAYASGAPYKYWENMAMSDIVKSVKKLDDLKVQFQLKEANAPFLANLAMQFMFVVSPTAVLKFKEAFDQNPVGTGPYTLKAWKKDDQMELAAFPNYWGEKAKISRVIIRVIPDAQVRLLELKKGSVHIMLYPNPSEVAALEVNPEIKVLKSEGLNLGYVAFNMKKPPLDKWEVREAISMAIDRNRIRSEVFQNLAAVAKNPMPPMILGYANDTAEIEYNPEKAKGLLKKAGVKDLNISLWAMPVARDYNPNPKKMAEFMQADLKRIGVTANIVSYDWGTYLDKIGKGEHDLCMIGWTGDNGDPDNFLMTLWSKDSAVKVPTNNYAYYMNDSVTNWLKEAQRVTNLSKRAELYHKVQIQMAKDRPLLPIAHSLNVVPIRAEIDGYVLQPTGDRKFSSVRFLPKAISAKDSQANQ